MNTEFLITEESISNKMYFIRGEKVMLDSDLAEIYGYTTKAFNQQVQRNIEKFDSDFMFQLTMEEAKKVSRSQIVTLNETIKRGTNIKYLPYAFTEQGIYMLMTILKGELATRQTKALIRLFKGMKDYIIYNNMISHEDYIKLATQTSENTKDISIIKTNLNSIMNNFIDSNKYKELLILNGEKVEADIAYSDIYSYAEKSIYIIDNYISLKTLVLLRNVKVPVIIFSDNINNGLHEKELDDFIKEYNVDIEIKKTNNIFHDRYIILDYKLDTEKIYHCGASSKDSGKRITTITEIEDKNAYYNLIDKLLDT